MNINLKFFSFQRKISVSKQWMQFGIIVITILASMVIAYWASGVMLFWLDVLLVGLAVAIALIIQPNLGYLFIFIGGMWIPIVGPSNINAAVVVVALMLGLWLWKMLVIRDSFHFFPSRVMLPVMLFLLISVLAFGMGQIPWYIFAHSAPLDAQAGGFAIFVLSAGTLLMTGNIVQEERWLQIIVWTFIGLGAIYMLGRALGLSQIDILYHRGFSANSMFWTWFIALSLSQAIFNDKLRFHIRALLIAIVLMTFYVAVVQAYNWKSGWMPALVAAAILLGLKFPRLLILSIPFVLIGAYFLATGAIGSDEYSWGTRLDAWKIVLEISKVNPLLGLGFSNYYWYTPLFPIRGWFVTFNSHSQYVDLIAQVGLLGLFCFLWIFFEVGRLSWKLLKQLPNGFAHSYTYGVFAGLLGSLMAAFLVDWILPFVYNIGFNGFRASILVWIFFGGLVSLEQIYLGRTKA
jgi:hypothetical protein